MHYGHICFKLCDFFILFNYCYYYIIGPNGRSFNSAVKLCCDDGVNTEIFSLGEFYASNDTIVSSDEF